MSTLKIIKMGPTLSLFCNFSTSNKLHFPLNRPEYVLDLMAYYYQFACLCKCKMNLGSILADDENITDNS